MLNTRANVFPGILGMLQKGKITDLLAAASPIFFMGHHLYKWVKPFFVYSPSEVAKLVSKAHTLKRHHLHKNKSWLRDD